MHRRLIAALLTLGLAFIASELSAQIIDFNKNGTSAPNRDEMVHPASCACAYGGACGAGDTCASGDGQILAGAGFGGSGLGPCGPGGCPSGGCGGDCHFAPYGHCLYPSPCWGACKGPCCRTIFGEMLLDIRRWCRKPKTFGSLSCHAIGASDSGPGAVVCTDGGCGDLGCADDNSIDWGCSGSNCGQGGLLKQGLLAGGLFRRLSLGGCTTVESTCGCETLGSCSASDGFVAVEANCGCEVIGTDECAGGCAGGAGTCFQDILSPRRPQQLMGKLGDFLFGSRAGCGSCSDTCFEADCGVEEISCGVETMGCAAATPPPATRQVAAEDGNPTDRSLAASQSRQSSERTAPATLDSQPLIIASEELPASSEGETGVVRRVRFDQQVPAKAVIRFRD